MQTTTEFQIFIIQSNNFQSNQINREKEKDKDDTGNTPLPAGHFSTKLLAAIFVDT